jgi:hypothetical protein
MTWDSGRSGVLVASPNTYGKFTAASPLFRRPCRAAILCERSRRARMKDIDPATRTELEAAAFRRLLEHLRSRPDVQNIDLMNLAGFCRNCLSNWLKDAADERRIPVSKEDSRTHVYGMPYDEWKARHQSEASAEKLAAFESTKPAH